MLDNKKTTEKNKKEEEEKQTSSQLPAVTNKLIIKFHLPAKKLSK